MMKCKAREQLHNLSKFVTPQPSSDRFLAFALSLIAAAVQIDMPRLEHKRKGIKLSKRLLHMAFSSPSHVLECDDTKFPAA